MKQQTAVEWLEKQLQKEEYIEKFGCVTYIINQAKEMEKQQIEYAYCNGCKNPLLNKTHEEKAEKYYKKTYNNETTNNH